MYKELLLLSALTITAGSAATVSYTGQFAGDGDVQLFHFTVATPGTITIQTWGFAGGVNAAGTTIPAGGFSPDIWLFNPVGTLLLADSPESPHHAAPADCGPRAVDPATGFCWDAYLSAALPAGSYTLALTQDGNLLADGFSLAGGFTEEGVPNYTDVNSLGGEFYLPDGLTQRDGNWALDISGISATTVPEPSTLSVLLLLSVLVPMIFVRRLSNHIFRRIMQVRHLLTLTLFLSPAWLWATDAPLVGDASVSSANPTLNFGNLPNLTVGAGNRALIQFDLSTLPPGLTSNGVIKATLQVFVNRVGTPGTLVVTSVISPWSESAITYDNLPATGALAGSGTISGASEYVSVDVTNQVQSWVAAPASNFGLELTSSGLAYLDSKESTTTSHPAKLDVTVAEAPPYSYFVSYPQGGTNAAAGYNALNNPSPGIDYNTAFGNGALAISTTGSVNTAVGAGALQVNTTGQWNQAFGAFSLPANTTGQYNTAGGFYALGGNTTGFGNAGFGPFTLYTNTAGQENTAVGFNAGLYNTSGSLNTFLGASAGELTTTGSNNIEIGYFVGAASDSNVIRIGNAGASRTFITGIRGATTGVSNAVEVVIDTNGQLGTINSSRRFKNDIIDMGDASSGLMKLRPVTFHYKQPSADGVERLEYGLIAEEVAQVYPGAVTYTPTGETETIQYHKINAMMLNEIQKQHRTIQEQAAAIDALQERISQIEKMVQAGTQGPEKSNAGSPAQ